MLNSRSKELWLDLNKLLSFDFTGDFCDELACEDVYTAEIIGSIRKVIDPDRINFDKGFDAWNAMLQNDLPGKTLDVIEDSFGEEVACDLEDYYFYVEKRSMLLPVFIFWHKVFEKVMEDEIALEITNDFRDEKLLKSVQNYLSYFNELETNIAETEITSEWDKKINGMCCIYSDEEDFEGIELDYVKELVLRYAFADISYDFWIKVHEILGDDISLLKTFAISIFGDEATPVVPVIDPDKD